MIGRGYCVAWCHQPQSGNCGAYISADTYDSNPAPNDVVRVNVAFNVWWCGTVDVEEEALDVPLRQHINHSGTCEDCTDT